MKRGDTKAGMKANIRYFIKWSALALVIGSVAGAAGTIFSMGVSWATGFRLSSTIIPPPNSKPSL